MKKVILGAAISAALSGGANAAINFDATTNQPDAATLATTTQVFLSGASAQQELFDRALLDGSAEGLCKAGTVNKFQDLVVGGTSGSLQTAYICEFNTSANGSATPNANIPAAYNVPGQNLLLYKRAEGGSFQGVGPIVTPVAIDFLNVTSNPTACTNGTAGLFASVRNCEYTVVANRTSHIPTFGVSDVNPQLFKAANELAPKGTPVVPGPSATTYQIIPGPQQVFGIVATLKLRNALQEVQFPASSACNPNNAGYTTGFSGTAESEACMPNLNSKQVGAILAAYAKPSTPLTAPVLGAGKFQSWDQFIVDAAGNSLWDVVSAANKPGAPKLHICSRAIGSGTKATTSVRFLDNVCNAKGNKLVQHADHSALGEAGETGYIAGPIANPENLIRPMVHAMSSGGGMLECMDELDTGAANTIGSFTPGAAYGAAGATAVRWAIGINSLDKNANLSKKARFIKIDGVAPTLANVASGAYGDWAEGTFQYNVTQLPAGDLRNLVIEMTNSFGTPSVVNYVNATAGSGAQSFGLSGFLAAPNAVNTYAANGVFDPANPVNFFSYAVFPGTAANATDNCRNPLVYSTNKPNATANNTGTQGLQFVH